MQTMMQNKVTVIELKANPLTLTSVRGLRRPPTINQNGIWQLNVTMSTVANVLEMITLIVETPGQCFSTVLVRADIETMLSQLVVDCLTLAIECTGPKTNVAFKRDMDRFGGESDRGEDEKEF